MQPDKLYTMLKVLNFFKKSIQNTQNTQFSAAAAAALPSIVLCARVANSTAIQRVATLRWLFDISFCGCSTLSHTRSLSRTRTASDKLDLRIVLAVWHFMLHVTLY